MKKKISITIEETTLKEVDKSIDGINIRNRSQAIEKILSINLNKEKIAVILATKMNNFRFLKKIKEEKIIIHLIKKLQFYNFKKVYFVGEKNILSKIFEIFGKGSDYFMNIEYVENKNPRGSADSLSLLKNKINSSFIVVPADNYFEFNLNKFWNFHKKNNNICDLAITISKNSSKLGVVEMEGEKVVGFKQKPDSNNNFVVWSGIMICEPEILYYDFNYLETQTIPTLIELSKVGGFLFTGEWKNVT